MEIDEFVAPPQERYELLLGVRIPMQFQEFRECNLVVVLALQLGYALYELWHEHTLPS